MPLHDRRVDDLGALVAGQRGEGREPLATEAPVHVVVVGVELAGLADTDHRAVLRRDRAVGLHGHPAARSEAIAEQSQQTERALENLKAIVEASGTQLNHVVKTTVYLKNMDDFPAMNEVYGRFFTLSPPARSTVQAVRLPKDALVEIDAIAAL